MTLSVYTYAYLGINEYVCHCMCVRLRSNVSEFDYDCGNICVYEGEEGRKRVTMRGYSEGKL